MTKLVITEHFANYIANEPKCEVRSENNENKVFIVNIKKEDSNDLVMQKFVSENPLFSGQVTIFKKDKEVRLTETIINKYERQYIYEVEEGKYRKYRYRNPFAWKDSKGKKVI